MIIKLETLNFGLSRNKTETINKVVNPITKEQWINADRIVMIAMFVATIIGAIIFQ